MTDFPYLYHEEIGTINITSEKTFRAAKIFWDAIAEKYESTPVPSQKTVKDPTYEEIERERKEVINEAIKKVNSLPESTEVKQSWLPDKMPAPIKKETAQKKIKALAPKGKNPGKSRKGIQGWSDEEMLLIQDIQEWREAVKVYKAKFPERRSDNAIEQQSKKIQNGIVKKRGTTPKPTQKPPKSSSEPNYKQIIKNSANPPHEPRINGAEDLEDQMPEEPTASRAEIRPGVRVKQVGGTKICAGIGTVKRCPNGKDDVLVAFDKGMEWMERKNLTVVPV